MIRSVEGLSLPIAKAKDLREENSLSATKRINSPIKHNHFENLNLKLVSFNNCPESEIPAFPGIYEKLFTVSAISGGIHDLIKAPN